MHRLVPCTAAAPQSCSCSASIVVLGIVFVAVCRNCVAVRRPQSHNAVQLLGVKFGAPAGDVNEAFMAEHHDWKRALLDTVFN